METFLAYTFNIVQDKAQAKSKENIKTVWNVMHKIRMYVQ